VIRVVVLDDHPAVLAGLRRLLEGSDGLSVTAAADTPEALFRALVSARADVAIVDYDLARGDGLAVCQRLKEHACAPGVVIYSAYAGPALALGARIAGADALVDKRAPVSRRLAALSDVASGRSTLPDVPPEVHQDLVARLDPTDLPVVAMLLAGTSHRSIADTLGTEREEVGHRVRRVLARLAPRPAVKMGLRPHGHGAPLGAGSTSDAAQPPARRHARPSSSKGRHVEHR
jgi:DNA-binding NarL/FixJ family response regulator